MESDSAPAAAGSEISESIIKRAVAASAVGNMLEWYDFTVYAFFSTYIAKNFFVSDSDTIELLLSFLTFGLGFIIRPLGALVLGSYGDSHGRKAVLTLTILIMGLGTILIGISPTYMSIGFVAPLIIVVARLIQGFSAGGEIGGSASLLIEYAPPARQGLYASWLQATMGMSNLIGASLATAITFFLTKQQVMDWGWRIPFLLGVIIVPVGFWIRHGVHESPEFQKLTAGKTEGSPKKTPLLTIFSNWPFILKGIGISVLWAAGPYVLIIYMPIYVHSLLGYGSSEAFLASFIGNWFLVGACFIAGWLYDTLGRTRTLVTSIIAIAILVYPLLAIVDASHSLATLIVVQSIFCFLVGLYVGPIPATLSRIFPVSIRVSGIAISYNLAIILFGGFAPAIIIWSSSVFTSVYTPGIYMIIACVIALFSISTIQKQREGN